MAWRLLFGLFVIGERQVYSAQRWVTADSVYRRKATIEARPSLMRRLAKPPTSSSSRAVIRLKSGATIQLGVRSDDLGRGLDAVYLVVFDESYNLRETQVSALAGAQLSAANAQTIYTSTAAVWQQQPNCQVLFDRRRPGQAGQTDLYYAEFCAEDVMPLDDPVTWAYANPSYGLLAKQRDIARLYAKAKTPDALALFKADILASAIGRRMNPKSARSSCPKCGRRWRPRRPRSSGRLPLRSTAHGTARRGLSAPRSGPPRVKFTWNAHRTNIFRRPRTC